MLEEIQKLVNVIHLAHKRGSFTLEESAVIYQLLIGLNKCPALQDKKPVKKDLEIIDEDVEME